MKTFRASRGPFSQQPYYELSEVESICLDELIRTGLYPDAPQPIRIDRFIEKRFGFVPEYEDLPEGVLGFSQFTENGVEKIIVARTLDEDQSQSTQRRVRTTLAHEAGHVLLHAHLFAFSKQTPLFGDQSEAGKPKVLCREVPDESNKQLPGYKGEWWEYQANMAMGALLLPRPLVEVTLKPFLAPSGSLGLSQIDESRRSEAVASIAEVFDVNPIVARLRLNALYPVNSNQMSL